MAKTIQARIVKEDDGLSHIICGRCLGTLEFVCDFHSQCHETQRNLQNEVKISASAAEEEILHPQEDDAGSNKENSTPEETLRTTANNAKKSSNNTDTSTSIDDSLNQKSDLASKHDNILADITDNYCEPPKPAAVKELFPKSHVKKIRDTPVRKAKQTDRKSILENPKRKQKKANNNTSKSGGSDEIQIVLPFKNVPVIVKQEPPSNENVMKPQIQLNQFVWVPNTLVLPEPEKPRLNINQKSKDDSILATGDEAEVSIKIPKNSSILRSTIRSAAVPPFTANEDRKSVIKHTEMTNELIESNISNSSEKKSNVTSKRRKSGVYGKVSELISAEQKKAIETYYTIDMSVINEKIVQNNYTMNDKKKIVCKLCNATYPRIDKCNVHIWGHLDMKPYRCNACDFATVTVTNIRCHIRKSHLKIKPFGCNVCPKRFVTASLLEEHANTHTGAKPYQCKICDFSSHSRQVLVYHHKTHKAVKDITCDICKRQFYTKGRLRAHMLIHNKDKSLMCKYCSQHFTNDEALQRHYKNVHSSDYVCTICGKHTKSRKALHNHQNVHSEAKFKCKLCPNVYKSSHILKEHLLKHEGIRKYVCDICTKSFAQQSHLAAHKAVHSDKRFFCPGCQRAFNRHDNMKMHTKRCDMFLTDEKFKDASYNVKTEEKINMKSDEDTNEIAQTTVPNQMKSKKTDSLFKVKKNESFQIGEVCVTPLPGTIESLPHPTKQVVTVTESIIGLECF